MKKIAIVIALLISMTTSFAQTRQDSVFIKLLNAYRIENQLSPVSYSVLLDSASRTHTEWMVTKEKVVHHEYSTSSDEVTYPGVKDRVAKFDPDYERLFCKYSISECVSGRFMSNGAHYGVTEISDEMVAAIFSELVKSPPHREILLMPKITDCGFELIGHKTSNGIGFNYMATLVVATRMGAYPVENVTDGLQ